VSEGSVWFISSFGMNQAQTGGAGVTDSGSDIPLTLILKDLDFLPDLRLGGKIAGTEWVDLALVDSAGDPVAGEATW
jgi:hypothetical protein